MRRLAKFVVTVSAALFAVPLLAETLSDPTRPLDSAPAVGSSATTAAAAPSGPVLQSTLISPLRRSAVISGRTVKIGDTVDGAKVVDIQSYEVRLRRGGREASLRLLPKLAKEQGKTE